MRRTLIVLLLLASLPAATLVRALPILYSITASGSGQLGAVAFSDSTFTISGLGDTDSVEINEYGLPWLPLTLSIKVDGAGEGVFSNLTQVVVTTRNPAAGFGDNTLDLAILFVNSPALTGYDLTGAIGPLPGGPSHNYDVPIPTTAGAFRLYAVSAATFQAKLVPEPLTFSIAASSLLGVAAIRRRRAVS